MDFNESKHTKESTQAHEVMCCGTNVESNKNTMGCCSSTNAVHPSNNNIISEEAGQDVKPKDPPISNQQIEIIMKNWKIVEQDPQGNGIKLFKFLFEQNPDIRKKFYFAMESENDIEEIMGDERLARHAKGVIDTISVTVAMLNDLASVVPVLKQLGASHARFNLQPAHFKAVGAALFHVLEDCLAAADFNEEARSAWTLLFAVVTTTMMAGMADVEKET